MDGISDKNMEASPKMCLSPKENRKMKNLEN